MTPAERRLFNRLRRRAAHLEPKLSSAILDGFEQLSRSMSDADLLRIVEGFETISDAKLDRAFSLLQSELQKGVSDATSYFGHDIERSGFIQFNVLNPRFIDAVRSLDTRVVRTLRDGIRETVRQHIEAGIVSGENPRVTARSLREVIGLAPNQEEAVRNYRKKLESRSKTALEYKLRDKRYDKLTAKGELTPEQIDRAVARYREKWVKWNAEVNARTASIDAMKLGQRLSWEDAISKGVVEEHMLYETWVTAGDERVRPEHEKMHGERKHFSGNYSNGDKIPGESSFNCRCISRVTTSRKERVAA